MANESKRRLFLKKSAAMYVEERCSSGRVVARTSGICGQARGVSTNRQVDSQDRSGADYLRRSHSRNLYLVSRRWSHPSLTPSLLFFFNGCCSGWERGIPPSFVSLLGLVTPLTRECTCRLQQPPSQRCFFGALARYRLPILVGFTSLFTLATSLLQAKTVSSFTHNRCLLE